MDKKPHSEGKKPTYGDLEDRLKDRDRTIFELRQDLEKAQNLIAGLREHAEDNDAIIESWIEAFNMVQDENGVWRYAPFIAAYEEVHEKYKDLLREWNKFVPEYNAVVNPPPKRSIGRPLEASPPQQRQVLSLRHEGNATLREIAETMSLSLRTVRTIIERGEGRDRGTVEATKLRKREMSRLKIAEYRSRKRTRDALPGRVNKYLAEGRDLAKRARS